MPSSSFAARDAGRVRAARSRAGILTALALVMYCGCSLDQRVLVLGDEEAAGGGGRAGAAGGRTSGGAGTPLATAGAQAGGAAGDAGQGGDADGGAATFPDGCTDLDHNGESDCAQTLLENSTFRVDTGHWLPEPGATIAWDSLDLLGVSNSGSALVTSSGAVDALGSSLVAADQCVAVHGGKVVDAFANVRIDPSAVDGSAAIGLFFFPIADCPGDSTSYAFVAAQTSMTGQTVALHGVQAVPDDMLSLRVRLAVIKPFKAQTFSVRFDNVLVVEH